ncbi:MAG: hypothetical protein K6G04_07010 [Lachnospiraceae bacterium]|nr:hypothetical protein [Lachnospiraceae bacterium]
MLKKFCRGILMVSLVISLCACGKEELAETPDEVYVPEDTMESADGSGAEEEAEDKNLMGEEEEETRAPLDLTTMSSTMVYAEVLNMVMSPKDYEGCLVTMGGQFAVYTDPKTNETYFACIIMDATQCCQQGIEFQLAGDYTYPDDYPEAGANIVVSGTFESYEEDGMNYLRLANATMTT